MQPALSEVEGRFSKRGRHDPATNHILSLPGANVLYDTVSQQNGAGNGNLASDSYHTYQWDAENRPLVIDTYFQEIYDAFGRMVEQDVPAYGWFGEFLWDTDGTPLALSYGVGSNTRAFIRLPGGAEAVYDSGALAQYFHPDWLGSTRLGSNPDRSVYTDVAFAPYGEKYADTGGNSWFAGLPSIVAGDQYDPWFRRYNTTQGRWISPDPAGLAAADPSNPQSWNRYAYVMNNPLMAIDPLGLCSLSDNPPCVPTTVTVTAPGSGNGGTNGDFDAQADAALASLGNMMSLFQSIVLPNKPRIGDELPVFLRQAYRTLAAANNGTP